MSQQQNTGRARRVVVTGLGFITSIGNDRAQGLANLNEGRSGLEHYPELEPRGGPAGRWGAAAGAKRS